MSRIPRTNAQSFKKLGDSFLRKDFLLKTFFSLGFSQWCFRKSIYFLQLQSTGTIIGFLTSFSTVCTKYVIIFNLKIWNVILHSGPENLKKSRQKNSWNQINQFHEIIFWPKSIFCNFKNGQKSIFELGVSQKKIFIVFISRVFFA